MADTFVGICRGGPKDGEIVVHWSNVMEVVRLLMGSRNPREKIEVVTQRYRWHARIIAKPGEVPGVWLWEG